MDTAILLVQSPDRRGIVAGISEFLLCHGCNIIQLDQYSTDPENGRYFMRVEFCFDESDFSSHRIEQDFCALSASLDAQATFHYPRTPMRMGILVSRYDHCLFELLYRWKSGELSAVIPAIISNHESCAPIAAQFGIPFHYVEIDKDNKQAAEQQMLLRLRGSTDFLVLARYMQIISSDFLNGYGKDIINIHHSFLPSFKGADPYRQAHSRGVKIIGATAHYVTADLDEGPIIEQLVERVSHRDNVEALKRKGRNLEKLALAGAVRSHLEHRIIRHQNKTVVFE